MLSGKNEDLNMTFRGIFIESRFWYPLLFSTKNLMILILPIANLSFDSREEFSTLGQILCLHPSEKGELAKFDNLTKQSCHWLIVRGRGGAGFGRQWGWVAHFVGLRPWAFIKSFAHLRYRVQRLRMNLVIFYTLVMQIVAYSNPLWVMLCTRGQPSLLG